MNVIRLIVGPISTNCYILHTAKEINIIDPGDEADKILEEVNKLRIPVKNIINTHYHFDHTDANAEIKAATKAALLIHEREKNFINFSADRYLRDNEKINLCGKDFEVLPTPGHTAGSFCLISEEMIFTGDTLFKDGYGRTDLPGGSDEAMEESLELLKKKIRPGTQVYPGHGEIFKA